MNNNRSLLVTLLQTLVDEWGHAEVMEALAVASARVPSSARQNLRRRGREVRVSATGQIERTGFDGPKREILLQLAERYDDKRFLPSVADVREFLIMMGERPIGMKDRSEAFRVLLRSLIQLPVEQLQQLARNAQHSGPSELGPISDAIAEAGQLLPRQHRSEMAYDELETGQPTSLAG